MLSNFKEFFKKNEADIILVIGVILIALISFGGGWFLGSKSISLSNNSLANVKGSDDIQVEEFKESQMSANPSSTTKQENNDDFSLDVQSNNASQINSLPSQSSQCNYVGSKNSNVYHLPDCPGVKRIKEENRRCFSSKEEAEKAGYRPAKNCPGLQ